MKTITFERLTFNDKTASLYENDDEDENKAAKLRIRV